MNKKVVSFLLWLLPVAFVQLISQQVTVASINPWYATLKKGWWTPPAWVFGPVWTVLYLLMVVSVWMVYWANASKQQRFLAYSLFFAQLFANGLWSFLFFGLHAPGWALLDLGLLLVLIAMTSLCFFRIRPLAGVLQFPYLIWSAYALSLNAAIFWLN